ncbi:hypothetical protein [Candidatus Formimonas warabiya]|nr:hypothetical protein [Candidatus Formimonas warabiya]
MTKERLFEFLILLGSLEYQLESFAAEMDRALLSRKLDEQINLN